MNDVNDAISRQQAIETFKDCAVNGVGIDGIVDALEQLSPIQPDIVRCKDCKHWIPYDWMFSEFSEMWLSKNIADYPEDEIGCDCSDMAMKANDFCSRGEKRGVTT